MQDLKLIHLDESTDKMEVEPISSLGPEEKKENQDDLNNSIPKTDNKDSPVDTDLIDKQSEAIRKEIEEDSPLISDTLPLEMLEFEFADNPPFLKKIQVLLF